MEVLLIYAAVLAGLIVLGVLFYLRAVASRKHYRCPQCGERMTTELMSASHCNMCGAPLKPEETRDA